MSFVHPFLRPSSEPWSDGALNDYWCANDDLRKNILLKNGVPSLLETDALRLFPISPKPEEKKIDWAKWSVIVAVIFGVLGLLAAVFF